METKVALIAVIVSDKEATARLNEVLHESSEYIIGMTGKLGAIAGVSAKTVYPQKIC